MGPEKDFLNKFYILGQGNFAIAMILENLQACYPNQNLEVEIIANIPAEENESLDFPYAVPGIFCKELSHDQWIPNPAIPCFPGSIGKSRKAIFTFFREKFDIQSDRYLRTIHPSSSISPTLQHGYGLYVGPLSVVGPHTHFGDFVALNRKVSVGHHTVLEDFVSLNPGVDVAGICTIGKGVMIGAGATVLDKVKIGEGSIIGAGSVVTKDLPAGVVAYGIPAKIVREVK